MLRLALLAAAALCQLVSADKTYTFNIGWVNAAPDGFSRPVIGINGKWPIPKIEASVGEKITVQVTNNLGNETTSLHFHGLRQFHTNQMDGPSAVTQCPIPPGGSYTYSFIADAPGTYWYHSHNMGQYPDGLRGPLIIHDPKNAPYAGKYDKAYEVVLSDWYHQQSPAIIEKWQSPLVGGPPETPIPDSILMNDGQSTDYDVKPGRTYLFRILNVGAFPSFFLNFQDLDMTVVGIDGVYTQPTSANTLYVGAAQRYEVLVTAKKNATSNSAILAMVDTSMFEGPAPTFGYNGPVSIMGQLVYPGNMTAPPAYQGLPDSIMPPTDDMTMKPYDSQPLLGPVTKQIVLDFGLALAPNGVPRAIINNSTYLSQKVPTLFTAMTAPQDLKLNPAIYGANSNSFPVQFGDIVEIVINNLVPTESSKHPWHLHGHQFQVVARGGVNSSGTYDPSTAEAIPMRRDVAGVLPGGFVVFRFKADNPGIQLLHCHIEWHVEAGLSAAILEATDLINTNSTSDPNAVNIVLDKNAQSNCAVQGIPLAGNAAGNTVNWLDLTGANTVVPSANTGALYTASKKRSRVYRH